MRRPVDPDILTADEVAELLGLSRVATYEGAARREIPSCRVGRRILFSRRAILAWLHGDRQSGEQSIGSRSGSPRPETE